MSSHAGLRAEVEKVLPPGEFQWCHIETIPFVCKSLIPLNAEKRKSKHRDTTIKIKHFIYLADSTGTVFFGIELFMYLVLKAYVTDYHLFVSKVDTTGLLKKKINISNIVERILKYFLNYNVLYYCSNVKILKSSTTGFRASSSGSALDRVIARLRNHGVDYYKCIKYYNQFPASFKKDRFTCFKPSKTINVKLSLFTRASDQYLFPYSGHNIRKHVIDGDTLLKWWIQVVKRVTSDLDESWKCRLIVPGSENRSMSRFIPENTKWSIGSIFEEDGDSPAVFSIPLFPDDPKGRFLEHLIVENRASSTTGKSFWKELGYRQEFRLGNVVGIIGCSRLKDGDFAVENTLVNSLSLYEYKKLINTVKGVDYSDLESAQSVTNTVKVILQEYGKRGQVMTIRGSDSFATQYGNKISCGNRNDGSTKAIASVGSHNVNNLNNVVRKKPKKI